MNRKKVLTIMMLIVFLLSSFLPMLGVSASTTETITLNSSLYKAIKAQLEAKGIYAIYNDEQYTLTISQDAINTITELNLSNNEISDLTGLDKFVNVTSLDLSANELSKDSNLEVLNSLNLKFLDLSSNKISDVSAITNIKSIATVNLHNQKFEEVTIINNSMVKDGTIKYEVELPQVVRDFAKPMKSEWLQDSYINNKSSNIKFDWVSFNSNSDTVKLVIGTQSGTKYNGLATLKIKVTDMNNKLYNSEINLYFVVIDENQRAVSFKDKNLYEAVKAQLTKGQTINEDLDTTANLYDYAYDEQKILVINENTLVNDITSLVLENKRIEDLSGIEMFIGLEKVLDVSSNYIDTIDRIVDLQVNKDEEEAKLQTRFREKAAELREKVEKFNKLKEELKSVIKAYNEAAGKYNSYLEAQNQNNSADNKLAQLEIIKTQGKRYIELTGDGLTIFNQLFAKASDLDNLTKAEDIVIAELSTEPIVRGGEIASANSKVKEKFKEIYKLYNEVYKITSVITPELRNITDEEFKNLSLESAKSLFQAQVSKLSSIEKDLTSYEKEYLQAAYGLDFSDDTKTPVATYYSSLAQSLAETQEVARYKDELAELRIFDSFATITNTCLINQYNTGNKNCVGLPEDELELKEEDGESTYYILTGYELHNENKSSTCPINSISDEDINAIAGRIAKASDADITAHIVLPRLYRLNITENLIENIDKISALKELRRLYAGENEITKISDVDWSAIKMLNTLNLSFNNISEIKALEVLKNLKILDVSKNLIKGSFDFTVTNMQKLELLNLASNQIDDIEYLKTQYEFIAKANDMEISEYLNSEIAPTINLNYQDVSINATVEQTASTVKIELPKIFAQFEELQWEETSFGISSLYGNVTSDGKYVLLDISELGTKAAQVTVLGDGIGSGTSCTIRYTVVGELDRTAPVVEFKTNGGSYTLSNGTVKIGTVVNITDNVNVATAEYAWATSNIEKQENYIQMTSVTNKEISMNVTEEGNYYLWIKATDNSGNVSEICSQAFVVSAEKTDDKDNNKPTGDIVITINTNDGSSVKAVKNVNDTNYLIVSADSTVSDVLKEVSLNTEDYKVIIKDASGKNAVDSTAKIKTNESLVVEGLEDKTKCVIVVKGDLTGDGDTTMSDILKLNQYRNEKVDLTEAEVLAGNVIDSDEEITMNDILKLNQYRLNKINEL